MTTQIIVRDGPYEWTYDLLSGSGSQTFESSTLLFVAAYPPVQCINTETGQYFWKNSAPCDQYEEDLWQSGAMHYIPE